MLQSKLDQHSREGKPRMLSKSEVSEVVGELEERARVHPSLQLLSTAVSSSPSSLGEAHGQRLETTHFASSHEDPASTPAAGVRESLVRVRDRVKFLCSSRAG